MVRIALATIVLNEAEFIDLNWRQHRHWPGCIGRVFVHGACRTYAEANPGMTTVGGFSVDSTSAALHAIEMQHRGAVAVMRGWSDGNDPAQEKCSLRNAYLRVLETMEPDWLIVVDADEFYTESAQRRVTEILSANMAPGGCDAILFRQRHLWWPPSVQHDPNRFRFEATGAYFAVPHCRVYRWRRGLEYAENHNEPTAPDAVRGGRINLHEAMVPMMREYPPDSKMESDPVCLHLGFARRPAERLATNRYYVARGEGTEQVGRNRSMYVESREAWREWQVGDELPHGGKVIEYDGEIPEVFLR